MKAVWGLAIVVAALWFLTACGGASSNQSPPSNVSITVSPTSFTMGVGSNLQFIATVTGTNNAAVTWLVNQTPGGDSSVGTITPAGLYIAPGTVPASSITVTAVADADRTKTASASVTLTSNVSITVSPTSFTMGVGSNLQFIATVTGTSNTAVTWQVNQTPGSDSSVGTITTAGLYIAPATMPASAITVTALAQADGTSTGSAFVTLTATDPVGSAQGTPISCPADANVPGSCYSVDLSCPGVADFTAYVKVTSPTVTPTPIGTVMFTGGGNGTGLYEAYTNGDTAVNNVVAAGFTAVQTSFGGPFTNTTPKGWQTGPGGIRRLACRYATLAQWAYASPNVHNNDKTKPLCATGNSSGGQLIAETLAHYGTDSIFSMVEPTSGPPFSDMEKSCICGSDAQPVPRACFAGTGDQNINQCLALPDAQNYVDPAYSAPICSQARSTQDTTNQALFISDSIQSPDATLSYPHTYVHFIYGGQDTSSAVTLGPDYMNVIINSAPAPPPTMACVADAPHSVADVLDGAQQVANDIISGCHLYP